MRRLDTRGAEVRRYLCYIQDRSTFDDEEDATYGLAVCLIGEHMEFVVSYDRLLDKRSCPLGL